ncbi:hypothetical protein CMO93_04170 [Candidatus Woesearchaeota archaeon]|nr:hypothetical protein [Candidatus Woesearchaeota archaeon]|tara:strand:- start:819 stop:2240 length:1422 start_codon:yes stop_codon:yes gene_type:complete
MKKIRILFVSFVLMVFLVQITNAANVGIVVEFPDGSVKTDCVSVDASTSGHDILQKSTLDITWSSEGLYGYALCKIDGVGDEVASAAGNCVWDPNLFWAFFILDGNAWQIASVGAGSYTAVDKDVLGFARSGFDFLFNPTEEPPLKTYEQVCEKLDVKDIKVYVDGKKESGADEDGGKIDAIPGSKLELKIKLENLYTDDEDVDIEEITIEGTLEDIDNGDDIEDDADDFDIKAEKDKDVTLKFDIPMEVEEDDYDLIVEIEGQNENGFPYSKTIEFEVEVEKEKHDVVFDKLEFLESSFQCGQPANLKVKVVNLGTEAEEVKLVISNQESRININENFELSDDPFDKDNSFTKTYKIMLSSDINPGLYLLRADLFYGDYIESSTAELNVACGENALELEEKSEEIKEEVQAQTVQTSQPTQTKSNIAGAAVSDVAVEEKNMPNRNIIMISILAGEMIILIVGITLLIHIFRR